MKTDYVLQMFTSDDILRPNLLHPFDVGNFTYATDGHSMVRVEKQYVTNKYEAENHPDVEKFFKIKKNEAYELKIQAEELALALSQMIFAYKKLQCEKCDGEGSITCPHCGNEEDCKNCGGSGEAGPFPFNVKVGASENEIQIGERIFKPHLVDRLLIAALASGEKEITLINNKNDTNGAYFQVGVYSVLIMPILRY